MKVSVIHDTSGFVRNKDVTNQPCPAIMVGVNSLDSQHYKIVTDPNRPQPPAPPSRSKPEYRVPLMDEIRQLPWNGYNVVSTFSGAGGSCTGYRMAGYRVLYANEFVPAAQETYKANHPESFLDVRDIRTVTPDDIRNATGKTEIDLLDGSPPCASFSTAGNQEQDWGKVKPYSDTEQRTDDLFFEFARLLKGLQPKTFVAENVSGLVKGTAKGYFIDILGALKASGYRVRAKLLDAQWLGVPQMRQRVIFVGVREDLDREPVHPVPLPYRYTVRDALPWIIRGKYGEQWKSSDHPSSTVSAGHAWNAANNKQGLEMIEAETDITRFAIGKEWDKIKPGQSSEKYFQLIKPSLNAPCATVTAGAGVGSLGCAGVVHPLEKRRFSIAELKRICAFPDDYILTGNYSQQWERCGRAVPPVMMSHVAAAIRDRILNTL